MTIQSIFDVAAPAKLNLFLHVTGRRPDGYHLLQSLFVLIDWQDTLHFERRADGRLWRHDLTAPLPADDLCLRAARLLQAESHCSLGADISIDKQVPWGAGMGGGSSDAASTLLALNRLWGLDWPLSRLLPLAAQLGADVPFFVAGTNALVEGIGEILTPLNVPPLALAVVKPAAAIETRALFASPLLTRDTEAVIVTGLSADAQPLWLGFGRNDMQSAAEAVCPEVAQAVKLLGQAFGNSRMTGSGSAVFARLGPAAQADENSDSRGVPGVAILENLPPGWTGKICRSLSEHPLAGWAKS